MGRVQEELNARLERIESILDSVVKTQSEIAEGQDKLMQAMQTLLQALEAEELGSEPELITLDGQKSYGERDQQEPL